MSKKCSFCGKTEEDGVNIIEGAEGNICTECIVVCNDTISELEEIRDMSNCKFLKPHEIKAELDKYVIGQDEAKKILSVAVYNHYKRINIKTKVEIQKTNILLCGPTGSGKSYVMENLARILDVPFVIADATSLTEAGYVGEDVESILERLIKKANNDVAKAEKGIVYIDEIDKLAIKKEDKSKDPSGEGVQQALLKMIEGSEVFVGVNDGLIKNKKVSINTKNILFVCGGAFVGMEDIIKKRCSSNGEKVIGFGTSPNISSVDTNKNNEIIHQDVVSFGLLPEFVGRLPVIATLTALSKEELTNILIKPKNAIVKQYQALLRADGVNLSFEQDAIDFIVEEASKRNTGARGLKGVIEKRMYDLMFEIPKQNVIKDYKITKEFLSKK